MKNNMKQTLETSLICILLSASRDVHFDKRMMCFLSGKRKIWKNQVIFVKSWSGIGPNGIWMGHFFFKNWYLCLATFKFSVACPYHLPKQKLRPPPPPRINSMPFDTCRYSPWHFKHICYDYYFLRTWLDWPMQKMRAKWMCKVCSWHGRGCLHCIALWVTLQEGELELVQRFHSPWQWLNYTVNLFYPASIE